MSSKQRTSTLSKRSKLATGRATPYVSSQQIFSHFHSEIREHNDTAALIIHFQDRSEAFTAWQPAMTLTELLKNLPDFDIEKHEVKDKDGVNLDSGLPLSDLPTPIFVYPKEHLPCKFFYLQLTDIQACLTFYFSRWGN